MENGQSAAVNIFLINIVHGASVEVKPLQAPQIIRGGVGIGIPAVQKNAVSGGQRIGGTIIGKCTGAGGDDEEEKRSKIFPLAGVWLQSGQFTNLLEIQQRGLRKAGRGVNQAVCPDLFSVIHAVGLLCNRFRSIIQWKTEKVNIVQIKRKIMHSRRM